MIKLNGLYLRKGNANYWQIVKAVTVNAQGVVFQHAFEEGGGGRETATASDAEKLYKPAPVEMIRKVIDIVSYQSSSLIDHLENQCALVESEYITEKLQRSIANSTSQEDLLNNLKKVVSSSEDGDDVIIAPSSVLMAKVSSIDTEGSVSRRNPVFDNETVQDLAERVAALTDSVIRRRGSFATHVVPKTKLDYSSFLEQEDMDETDNE